MSTIGNLTNKYITDTKFKILVARGLYTVITFFVGKKPRVISRGGINYEVDLSEGIDLSIFLFGRYQEHVSRNKNMVLPKDSVIIDIGANIGAMTLPFAKIASAGKVYAFEPTAFALAKLKRNLEINPELASHVEVINSFISSVSSKNIDIKAFASWKVNGEKVDAPQHALNLGIAKPTDGVGAISLDDFCKARNLTRIDLIKIDTDGHEHEILLGAKETIKKYRPQLVMEAGQFAMEETKIDITFYLNYFKELNYRILDAIKGVEINAENYKKYIPLNGTTDIIAQSCTK